MQMTSHGKNDKNLCKSFNGTVENKLQDIKTDPYRKKSPLRMEKDWSEHISSKGLIYYYNCRTEVSQWQKPNEWTLLPMTNDEIKRILNSKLRNGDVNTIKRPFLNSLSQDLITSPKRIKFNNHQSQVYKRVVCENNNNTGFQKIETIKGLTANTPDSIIQYSNDNKNKHLEANFFNDDMDISPNSSPMSKGSHSDDFENKKQNLFEPEVSKGESTTKSVNKYVDTSMFETTEKSQISPRLIENSSLTLSKMLPCRWSQSVTNNHRCQDIGTIPTLTQHHISLVAILRSTLGLLQLRSPENNRYESCLSVSQISELLSGFEAVLNNGGIVKSYRSHRLQTQLLQNRSIGHGSDTKSVGKLSANIGQIKELVKYIQDFIQDHYPNLVYTVSAVSPNYSRTARMPYYLQVLHNLVDTCLTQLCPQNVISPSSTSSPGSLKDTNSSNSLSISVTSHPFIDHTNIRKTETDSASKKDRPGADNDHQPSSILTDSEMVKFVSNSLSNGYRNQLADCYVHEAQTEYYKFVRLHSVLYPELACESKKLKALVRISEINTELFRHKKEDLERLVRMIECRRMPSRLTSDHPHNT